MIFRRTCRRCDHRSRDVKRNYEPIQDYLDWRYGWRCSDERACGRRQKENDALIEVVRTVVESQGTNDMQVFK